jgi:hypothetical protein
VRCGCSAAARKRRALIFFTPTFSSSGKNTKIWRATSGAASARGAPRAALGFHRRFCDMCSRARTRSSALSTLGAMMVRSSRLGSSPKSVLNCGGAHVSAQQVHTHALASAFAAACVPPLLCGPARGVKPRICGPLASCGLSCGCGRAWSSCPSTWLLRRGRRLRARARHRRPRRAVGGWRGARARRGWRGALRAGAGEQRAREWRAPDAPPRQASAHASQTKRVLPQPSPAARAEIQSRVAPAHSFARRTRALSHPSPPCCAAPAAPTARRCAPFPSPTPPADPLRPLQTGFIGISSGRMRAIPPTSPS